MRRRKARRMRLLICGGSPLWDSQCNRDAPRQGRTTQAPKFSNTLMTDTTKPRRSPEGAKPGGADGETRTPMSLRTLAPQASASTNSATSARSEKKHTNPSAKGNRQRQFSVTSSHAVLSLFLLSKTCHPLPYGGITHRITFPNHFTCKPLPASGCRKPILCRHKRC